MSIKQNSALAAVLIIAAAVTAANYKKIGLILLALPLEWGAKAPVAAAAAILTVYIVKSFFMFIPLMALFAAAGMTFSPIFALALSLVGLACEISIGYLLGKKFGKNGAKKIMAVLARYPALERRLERGRDRVFISAFILRFVPGPPLEVVSMTMGAAGAEFKSYFAGSLLGVLPVMTITVLLGDAAAKPASSAFLPRLIVGLAILAFMFLAGRHIKKKNSEEQM
jgi:uncharacterized membrane protein YdjX (TVP38/TMEM64 family)